jgi:hypothetical protein
VMMSFRAFGLRYLEQFGGWSLHVAHFLLTIFQTASIRHVSPPT